MAHINNSSPLNQDRVVDKAGSDIMNFSGSAWQINQGSLLINGHQCFLGTGTAQEFIQYMMGSGAYQIIPFYYMIQPNTGQYIPKRVGLTIPYRFQFLEGLGGPSSYSLGQYDYPYTGSPEVQNCTYSVQADAKNASIVLTITNTGYTAGYTYFLGSLWVNA